MGPDRDPARIRRMFASIAPRYDFLNRLLSLRVDQRWRRQTVRALAEQVEAGRRVLDLCTGTGDLALALAGRYKVVGSDFCHPMLLLGVEKAGRVEPGLPFVEADTLRLPFPSDVFEGVTVAFGLRNLVDYPAGIREMARVLSPGGVLGVLEFSVPEIPVFRQLYLFYFTRILPRLGRVLSGREGPYRYLPESVREFPDPQQLATMMRESGFATVDIRPLTGGIATLYLAVRDSDSSRAAAKRVPAGLPPAS